MISRHYYAILVKPECIKTIKIHLEALNLFNRDVDIRPLLQPPNYLAIPTNIVATSENEALRNDQPLDNASATQFLIEHNLNMLELEAPDLLIGIVGVSSVASHRKTRANPLHRAILEWIHELPRSCTSDTLPRVKDLLTTVPKAFNVYPPMLLLAVNTFKGDAWNDLFEFLERHPKMKNDFFQSIARSVGVTHIAINAPIPAHIVAAEHEGNVIRSPVHLHALYGDFGPNLPPFPQYTPNQEDYDKAFWVSTRQNGITQIWAPKYTMFSAGNVTEKARVLAFPSLREANAAGRKETAIDLFAGIGYFAFSYVKAGVAQVLCWDLNPWSIEGLRRGAAENNWTCQIFDRESKTPTKCSPAQLLVFCESNIKARERLQQMRLLLFPIRHVNCGTLPTIKRAWEIATEAIDPAEGGWIHIHETMAEQDVSRLQEEYMHLIQTHYDSQASSNILKQNVQLVHVETVKSMGPKLWHKVLDFHIPPRAVKRP